MYLNYFIKNKLVLYFKIIKNLVTYFKKISHVTEPTKYPYFV